MRRRIGLPRIFGLPSTSPLLVEAGMDLRVVAPDHPERVVEMAIVHVRDVQDDALSGPPLRVGIDPIPGARRLGRPEVLYGSLKKTARRAVERLLPPPRHVLGVGIPLRISGARVVRRSGHSALWTERPEHRIPSLSRREVHGPTPSRPPCPFSQQAPPGVSN